VGDRTGNCPRPACTRCGLSRRPKVERKPDMKNWAQAILQGVLGLAIFGAFWLGLAGRLDWWQGWVCLTAFTLFVALFAWRLASTNPDLLTERNRPGGEVPTWDQRIMRTYSLTLLIQLAVSALDSGRFRWSDMPLAVQLLGWGIVIAAGSMIWRVTMSNPFLSSSARLQPDRAQVVIQEGWYGFVRHPMYLAIAAIFIGMSLALASWWALIPATMNVGLFVYRTHREDEMLMHGLPGYEAYARTVKYRLIPRIW
jgi:protein-S-isoprenylcysteine O-methyltransferase Ste14